MTLYRKTGIIKVEIEKIVNKLKEEIKGVNKMKLKRLMIEIAERETEYDTNPTHEWDAATDMWRHYFDTVCMFGEDALYDYIRYNGIGETPKNEEEYVKGILNDELIEWVHNEFFIGSDTFEEEPMQYLAHVIVKKGEELVGKTKTLKENTNDGKVKYTETIVKDILEELKQMDNSEYMSIPFETVEKGSVNKMKKTNYIKVDLNGKEYTYKTELTVSAGDQVKVPVRYGNELTGTVIDVLTDTELVHFLETSKIAINDIKEVNSFARLNGTLQDALTELNEKVSATKLSKREQAVILGIVRRLHESI